MRKFVMALMVVAFALVPVTAPIARAAQADPDVIYYNGNIVTLDSGGSTADAVAVKDGKFLSGRAPDLSSVQ